MKCLIRMAADAGKGAIFYETVINLKKQRHTYIECVPVALNVFDELPAYFRVFNSLPSNIPRTVLM
jgi:CWF19-like protein 2